MVLSSMVERQRSDGSFVYQVARTWVVLRSSANKSKEMFPLVRVIFVVEYLSLKDSIMLKFQLEEQTTLTFWRLLQDTDSELELISQFCSSFNPFPSLPSAATDDRKQFQCRNIVLNNKTTPLFWGFQPSYDTSP